MTVLNGMAMIMAVALTMSTLAKEWLIAGDVRFKSGYAQMEVFHSFDYHMHRAVIIALSYKKSDL